MTAIRHWKRWAGLFVLGLLTMPIAAQTSAPVRVALMGPELAGSGEAALGLAEAELSGREGVELLDRATVGRVLREQDLAAGGLVQAEDAIRLGQLLAVDVFIHVEPIPGQEALGMTAFETAQGIRLLDRGVEGVDAEALAKGIAEGVESALAKWGAVDGTGVAVALMGVRNVDLPNSRDGECDSIGALLERRLLGSPDVVVVERKRLQSVNLDREIAPDRLEGRLMTAPVLVELDVSQNGLEEGYRVTAHLSKAKGGELGRVQAEGQTIASLTVELSDRVLEQMKAGASIPPASPAVEAARFFRQARFWKAQGRVDLALAAAEAAYALDPTHPVMQVLLVNTLYASANANMAGARPDALAYAARGIALMHREYETPVFSDPEQKKQFTQLAADNGNFFRGFGRAVGKSREENPFTGEESEIYAEFCREWRLASPFAADAEEAASNWDLLLFLGEGDAFYYCPDSESAWAMYTASMKRWCRERMATDRPHLTPSLLTQLVTSGTPGLSGPPVDYRFRSGLWTFFETQESPILRLYARCGRLVDAERLGEGSPESREEGWGMFLADLFSAIQGSGDPGDVDREHLYRVALIVATRGRPSIRSLDDHGREHMRQQLPGMIGLFKAMILGGDVRDEVLTAIKSLLSDVHRAGLTELWAKQLVEIDQSISALPVHVNSEMEPTELRKLAVFHDWVREQLEPGSTLPAPADNVRVEPVELMKPGERFLGHAAIVGDNEGGAYVVSASDRPSKLLLQKWTLGSPHPIVLGAAEPGGPRHRTMGSCRVAGVRDPCLGKSVVVVPVEDEGIFLFDRMVSKVTSLHEMTTLPITHPLSVGLFGQTLYVGTDDGYLVSLDIHTGAGEVLVASSRKEKKSPFDDGPPVHIVALMPDADRGRIVFVASVVQAESHLGMAVSDMSGIWEYRLDTGAFKPLISYRLRPDDVLWCKKVDDDSFVMAVRSYGSQVIRYSLEADAMDVLSTIRPNGKIGGVESRLLKNPGLKQPEGDDLPIERRQAKLLPPFLARGNWLWTSEPWGRLSMKTYQWEERPPFRMPDGTLKRIVPRLGIVPISDHQVLLAERDQLWLMTTGDERIREAGEDTGP